MSESWYEMETYHHFESADAEILPELYELWILADYLVDVQGQNQIMDAIIHLTSKPQRGDNFFGAVQHTLEALVSEDTTTALHRWMVDYVAQILSSEDVVNTMSVAKPSAGLLALTQQERMRLGQPNESTRPNSFYHMPISHENCPREWDLGLPWYRCQAHCTCVPFVVPTSK